MKFKLSLLITTTDTPAVTQPPEIELFGNDRNVSFSLRLYKSTP
jgi:hypothetical protein